MADVVTDDPRWRFETTTDPGDDVVISGMSGKFPLSDNVRELAANLYSKRPLTLPTNSRYDARLFDVPDTLGVMNDLDKYDALFFGTSPKQAELLDPLSRMLMETSFEAFLDAGINPKHIRGGNTAVFLGCFFAPLETREVHSETKGHDLLGSSRAMFANRISFFYDIHGPSLAVDSACSSSLSAFDLGYLAIKTGRSDSAIVGACNKCLDSIMTLKYLQLGVLTTGDACRCFDDDASGFVRGEAVAVVILQKAKHAKRVYATVLHSQTNTDGYKPHGLTYPSHVVQTQLFRQAYKESGVSPHKITFVETHATATRAGDPEELKAIDDFYSKGRKKPLKIGSIKSNVGHTEGAAGICSLIKALITMENGVIPPNIHFNKPRKGVESLESGRLQVVTEPTPWEEGYIGVNSYGFGGCNVHVIVRPNLKVKRLKLAANDDLPRLVCAAGRTEEAVASILDDVENRPVDPEYIRLLHDIFAEDIQGYLFRGFTFANVKQREVSGRMIEKVGEEKRPIWFVFSGMGSQWPGMGSSLMRFPIFAQAIQKCDTVLRPRGVDIVDILTNKDEHNFDNILRSFVGITALQIGLVDLLRAVEITPDNIIGHSVGELACAYADGCLTAEETILAAYSRGMASIEADLIHGSMAAVGLGFQEIKDMCPNDIEVACHNASDSSTISGPAESMKKFVAQLKAKDIFAKEVNCGNIAYHSRYIAPAGKKLLTYLREVIKNPRVRSEKWVSTSVPRSEWLSAACRLSSAEYHTNNLLSPVLFEETSEMIPKNAITIEIAPHGLLQAILRRSLGPEVSNFSLTKRGSKDNAATFLQVLGRLYNAGLQPQVANLYPKVEYPVSRGTPMISPLIKWDHAVSWRVLGESDSGLGNDIKVYHISSTNELGEIMAGHVIDGRPLVPATGYLYLAWELAKVSHAARDKYVVFEDVTFHRACIIPDKGELNLVVSVQSCSEKFEITESGEIVATGTIRFQQTASQETVPEKYLKEVNEPEEMNKRDVYKTLRLRGYHYAGVFRGIESASIDGFVGHVEWKENWVSFLDTIMQMQILLSSTPDLHVPTRLKKLVIDVTKHEEALKSSGSNFLKVTYHKNLYLGVCGGVEIRQLTSTVIPRRQLSGIPVVEKYEFVAHRDSSEVTLYEATSLFVNLSLEVMCTVNVKSVELIDDRDDVNPNDLVTPLILTVLGNLPLMRSAPLIVANPRRFPENSLPASVKVTGSWELPEDVDAVIGFGYDLLSEERAENLKTLMDLVVPGGFIASIETEERSLDRAEKCNLHVVMEKRAGGRKMVLLRKKTPPPKRIVTIHLSNNEFSWLEEVKSALDSKTPKDASENLRVVLVGEGFDNGLLGFINCLRREFNSHVVVGVLIQDSNAPKFSLDEPLYRDQLQLDLVVNVLRGNAWGTYRHLPLPPLSPKLVTHAALKQMIPGDFKSFVWAQAPLKEFKPAKSPVYIHYAALNFRDVMVSSGKLKFSSVGEVSQQVFSAIGLEYSGIDANGKRVMGMSFGRAFSNITTAEKDLVYDVPDDWSLEDASTVPAVYSTCYLAFYINGKLRKGSTILIHAGSGAVGQAAINLALHEGCEIFTTVGTPEKRQFIKDTFPSIDDDHIGNSRDTSFEQMVLTQTRGRGVDIVLNSLSGDKLHASVRCLAPHGQFLEIGKYDIVANTELGMSIFAKGASFIPVMIDAILYQCPETMQLTANLFAEGLKVGAVKALTRTVFDKNQSEAAFRYMAAGKHIGKVVIKIRNEGEPLDSPMLAQPRYYCRADRSHVIFGGLGGFGLELAAWLVERGAENLVLVTRSGLKNGYQRRRIKGWESMGVTVRVVIAKDATCRQEVESILRTAQELGPIDTIFNLAVSLKDGIYANQTTENFEESFKGKAWLTAILDELAREMCPDLRHFIVFSSVACGRGNPGQTNYGMANSVMERICERRVQDGLPGLAVQWGAIGDVGIVADMQVDGKELVIGGTLQQALSSCLVELEGFMQRDEAIVSSMVVAEKSAMQNAHSVIAAVQAIMGIESLSGVSPTTTLPDLGMDSMTAVEIKETLERDFDIFLTPHNIRTLTFGKLREMSKDSSTQPQEEGEGFELAGKDYFGTLIGTEDMYAEICVDVTREKSGNHVFLFPGLQGCSIVFDRLAPHIKSPATCLQMDLHGDRERQESVPAMVEFLLPDILARNNGRRHFTIVAYSYGALLAIETARAIEKRGMSANLLLIDGAPAQLKALDRTVFDDDEEENHTRFLILLLNRLIPSTDLPDKVQLRKCTSWEEKVEMILKVLQGTKLFNDISEDMCRKICEITYSRMISVRNYDIEGEKLLKSPITLLRVSGNQLNLEDDDYGLSKVTEGPIQIHHLEGDHRTIIENVKIAKFINDASAESG